MICVLIHQLVCFLTLLVSLPKVCCLISFLVFKKKIKYSLFLFVFLRSLTRDLCTDNQLYSRAFPDPYSSSSSSSSSPRQLDRSSTMIDRLTDQSSLTTDRLTDRPFLTTDKPAVTAAIVSHFERQHQNQWQIMSDSASVVAVTAAHPAAASSSSSSSSAANSSSSATTGQTSQIYNQNNQKPRLASTQSYLLSCFLSNI